MNMRGMTEMQRTQPHIPVTAHKFVLLVAGLLWMATIAWGAYIAIRTIERVGTEPRIDLLLAGTANVVGGIALLIATWQDWRGQVRLNRSRWAMFGFGCLAAATLCIAVLG